ncbi:ABC transporter substrate-binding protein [Zooshikella harenae]|nr:ABC transporter substrate-binding protein [Zooshikella harenae]
MLRALVVTASLLLSSLAVAVEYINIKPLNQVVSAQVGPVEGDVLQVPFISWGGDIAVIHANGNNLSTQANSIVSQQGLKLKLTREDDFAKQVQHYLKGDSPFLRGTIGMLNMAMDVISKDAKTKPIVIYKLTDSAGGDALVVKSGIKTVKDLRGKTVVLQAYGPHVDYLSRILADAGLTFKDINVRWVKDLTGTDNSPMAALYEKDIDAAFVIIPDALALTSGGSVGTGAEDSVKGAKILLSTKTADTVIADVYAVRSDFFKQHRDVVEKFARSLLLGQESMSNVVQQRTADSKAYEQMMRAAAKGLLDSEQALADAEGMYQDARHVGYDGNVKFFKNNAYPRRFAVIVKESQHGLHQVGLLQQQQEVAQARWDYDKLKKGLSQINVAEVPKFDESKVAALVTQKQQQGSLDQGELFSFEVFFKPNQKTFSAELYEDAFKKVMDLASTYGGAIITIEGHSDPMNYLRKRKANASRMVLGRIKQAARNLSLSRAQEVRDNIIDFSKNKGVSLDPSQFAVIGHGISAPKTGVCGADPCVPKTEKQWRSNMRVQFRILQVEAESSVFRPL